jgi:hypothetical protein
MIDAMVEEEGKKQNLMASSGHSGSSDAFPSDLRLSLARPFSSNGQH